MRFGSKVPGTAMEVRDVTMDFGYGHSFTEDSPEAYERLHPRRAARRPAAVPAARGGRAVLADPRPDRALLGAVTARQRPTPSGKLGSGLRPTRCWPATAGPGEGRDSGRAPRPAEDVVIIDMPSTTANGVAKRMVELRVETRRDRAGPGAHPRAGRRRRRGGRPSSRPTMPVMSTRAGYPGRGARNGARRGPARRPDPGGWRRRCGRGHRAADVRSADGARRVGGPPAAAPRRPGRRLVAGRDTGCAGGGPDRRSGAAPHHRHRRVQAAHRRPADSRRDLPAGRHRPGVVPDHRLAALLAAALDLPPFERRDGSRGWWARRTVRAPTCSPRGSLSRCGARSRGPRRRAWTGWSTSSSTVARGRSSSTGPEMTSRCCGSGPRRAPGGPAQAARPRLPGRGTAAARPG